MRPRVSEAQVPSFTVTGHVVEGVYSTWVGGATVRLSARAPFITGSDGLFRFGNVPAGSHTLRVEALGYRTRELTLLVRADTVVTVELEVDPIRLDSLLVKPGTIDLRGTVTEALTGRGIPDAHVRAGALQEAFANGRGAFHMKDLPRGFSIPVVVTAFRFLPARISLITERDTALAIRLEPDSLGIRIFARANQALLERTASVPLSVRTIDRSLLERTPSRSVYDVIKWRNGGRDFSTQCLFIDDKKQFDTDILGSYNASEVERIEVYRGSRMGLRRLAMIRVYTQEFVATRLGTGRPLQKILFVAGGIGPDTCY